MPKRKGYITKQAKRLTDGEINRRRFVMSALSAGVTLPTALSLASKAEAHTPKPGGTLRLALSEGGASDSLHPLEADNAFTRLLAFARGNTLTEITADGDVIGELAEDFSSTADHSIWRFDLRQDVSFQNGAPLTAEDVAATLTEGAALLSDLESIRVDGAHRIELSLAQPDPSLPDRLADPRLVILNSASETPIGTGPYVLDAYSPGERAVLTRNPDYWKPGRAHVDAVVLRHIPDVSLRQQAIMTGEVDYADGLDPRALALLQHIPEVGVLDIATGRNIAVTAHDRRELLGPISSALPHQEIVDRLLLGHGTPGAPMTAHAQGASKRPLRLGVVDSGVPRSLDIARLVANRLEDAGWPVTLLTDASDGTADMTLHWRRSHPDTQDPDHITLAWANDLSAYRAPLTHASGVGTEAENDGARLIERWWFS